MRTWRTLTDGESVQRRRERRARKPQQGPKKPLLRALAERPGFDLGRFCKLCTQLSLRFKSSDDKEFRHLVRLLFLHGFLPSLDAF